jgi:hypothetical protein
MTFTLLTMTINLSLLWLFHKTVARIPQIFSPLVIFGQAPLFFYISHLFLYGLLGLLLVPEGSSIPLMYVVWLVGLLILYPLCAWYGRFKASQPVGSIVRLF